MEAIVLAEQPSFVLGAIRVEPSRRLILTAPREIAVPPRAMQVLVALHQADGGVVSRSELNGRCWAGRTVSDNALDRVIAQLRRIAADVGGAAFSIETVHSVGFRLHIAAPAAEPASPAAGAQPGRRSFLAGAMAAGVLAVAGIGGTLLWRTRRDDTPAYVARIAVLPFNGLSNDPSAQALSAGVSREIADRLSRVSGLRLAADASAQRAALAGGKNEDVARQLGADFLVQGSVREEAGTLRITTQLISAKDGLVLWSNTDEGRSDNLFALQDSVAGDVLRELVGRVDGALDPVLPPVRRRDSRAVRLVITGRDLFDKSRSARMNVAEQQGLDFGDRAYALAQQALAIDPDDVGALLLVAGLVKNGWTTAFAAQPLTADQRVEASLAYIQRALSVDPNDPATLTALGDYYRRYALRWTEAERLFRKALRLNPSLVDAHWSYAYLLGTTGRALEGLAHAETVLRLDSQSTWRRVALPRLLFLAGDRETTMTLYRNEMANTPSNLFLIIEIYLVLLIQNDADGLDGLAVTVAGLQKSAKPAIARMIERIRLAAKALRGAPADFIAAIDADVAAYDAPAGDGTGSRLGRANVDYLYIYAIEYAWAAHYPRALDMLERALAAHALYWPATLPFGFTPFPKPMRDDPRFRAVFHSEPGLSELISRRLSAIKAGQMAGNLPNGTTVRPSVAAIRHSQRLL